MENLRLELSAKNASEPLYMGSIIANQVKTGYTSGGAGKVNMLIVKKRLKVH